MPTLGFIISTKEFEKRRVLLPEDAAKLSSPQNVYIETGYGKVLGIDDEEYKKAGCNVSPLDIVLRQDIICDPKIGDSAHINKLKNQTVFGWVHAAQNLELTNTLVKNNIDAIAWENMEKYNRNVFWRNNELAGEAAVMHAYLLFGRLPCETKAAVIGRGNTARGAIKIFNRLGTKVIQYSRRSLPHLLKTIQSYDIICNCVLWDMSTGKHIISKKDLNRMKKGSMIIDVSCDEAGAIETSRPTNMNNPVYMVDGIMHYAVDHTPSIFYKSFTSDTSKLILPYLEQLMSGKLSGTLKKAIIIKNGIILDNMVKHQYENSSYSL